ncbi:acyltransferase [Escherichia coli]|uniref:acyltransferase family protein n=1 Tax=Enterobacteriaceae TaxID=543 RepID=UPI0032D9FA86|nr:acyltransferase [Escherichia coli]
MRKISDVIFDRDHTNELKGVAILLVMLGHVNVIPHAGAYGVVLFLMLSGFGLVQSYIKSGLDSFFSKRLSKVLIPYAIITIVWISAFGHPAIPNGDFYYLVITILGIDLNSSVDPSMWYISFIIIWYLAFFLIFSANISINVKIVFLFLFSVFLYKNSDMFPPPTGAGLYVAAFPLGSLIGVVYEKVKGYRINKRISLLFVIVSLVSMILSIYFYKGIDVSFFDYAATNISSAFLVIGITSIFRVVKINTISLGFFGGLSYEMYLIEFMFLMKGYHLLSFVDSDYIKAALFVVIVSFFAYVYKYVLSIIYKAVWTALSHPKMHT